MRMRVGTILAAAIACSVAADGGGFSFDPLFCDGAVLQRDVEILVSGNGTPDAAVAVRFAGRRSSAKVGGDGRWCARIGPFAASAEGRELVAECGDERCVATNVLVGEVFLCSGQSNMQQPLWSGGWGGGFSDRKGRIEARIAKWPLFRYARISSKRIGSIPKWKTVDNEATATGVSAISYYFATTLLRAEPDIPVGIVNSAVGGSSIDSWLPGETGRLFGNMIAATGSFRFRAVLWYQGEANVRDGDKYTVKLHALAKGWRDAFGDPSLPFIVSEIAPFGYEKGKLAKFWRAQQRFAAEDGNAVCVPINDCGDYGTIHPDRKELPAMRYAAIALNRFYGRKDVPCEIPRAVRALSDGGGAVVEFEGVKILGVNSHPKYVKHSIPGFEVCGSDGKWRKAKAAIDGNRIRVFAAEVPSPAKVRYLGGEETHGEVYSADSNFVPSAFEFEVEQTVDADLQRKCQAVCDWAVKEGLQGSLQFCAYRDGKCIVDVWAGNMTTNAGAAKIDGATLFPIFSTEKPLLATAAHRAVEKKRMAYGKPLSAWWPEFAGDGKEKITLGLALGYRTGMSHAFPKGVSGVKDRCDWRRICELAAKEKPVDEPGTVQKYLSMSYGWIIGRPLELAMRKPLNEILLEEVLRPCAIEDEFYFAADDDAIRRTATVYKSATFETMNDNRRRRMCLPSAYAVANARSIARFYNRLCGFDGCAPLVSRKTLDMALKPCRHESDPLPPSEKLDRDWHMVFGMGYGLWGGSSDISRVFGHGGIGGSEGLCDRSKRLTVGFTCNFGKDVRKVRSKLYGIVGMKWRYWDDAEADIQNLQMRTVK
ncbi:MAG: hypothetical protein E7046_08870 [Lentisphaerae bacterium]|nr:hypothetical protein [Lentisphaerota bacterium]